MAWWQVRRALGRWLRRHGFMAAEGTPVRAKDTGRLLYRTGHPHWDDQLDAGRDTADTPPRLMHGRPHDARMAWDHEP